MLTGPSETIVRARKLRRDLTLPEAMLWRELRKRPYGLKFRRQHPAGPYVADFFCAAAKLAVEIDGIAHRMGDQAESDLVRDGFLAAAGVSTLRIAATDVLADVAAVVETVARTAQARCPSTTGLKKAGGPPPRSGEDQKGTSWTI